MKENQTFKKLDFFSFLAVAGVVLVLIVEFYFVFELYGGESLLPKPEVAVTETNQVPGVLETKDLPETPPPEVLPEPDPILETAETNSLPVMIETNSLPEAIETNDLPVEVDASIPVG